jgi:hypothetical protein
VPDETLKRSSQSDITNGDSSQICASAVHAELPDGACQSYSSLKTARLAIVNLDGAVRSGLVTMTVQGEKFCGTLEGQPRNPPDREAFETRANRDNGVQLVQDC